MTYRILAFETLASTNSEAMARLKAGDPGGVFVTAATQTGGRGRQGRAWASPPGNLYASLALVDPSAPARAPQLGFVAGVALAKVLRARLGGDDRLQIKWPNDMLYAGAKLAGLLLESTTLVDGRLGCVVGFGVNCASHPTGTPYPATDLAAAGDLTVTPETLLAALAETMEREVATWDRGAGFARIRVDWLAMAAGIGEPVRVATPRGTVEGLCDGLDVDGRLVVATGQGRVLVEAGDVFFGTAAGSVRGVTANG